MDELIIVYLSSGFVLGLVSLVVNWQEVIDEGPVTAAGALLWMTVMWLPIMIVRAWKSGK
jgi:hypothetical protein